MKWIIDLRRVAESLKSEGFTSALELARQTGAMPSMALGLALLRVIYAQALPAQLATAAQESPAPARLVATCIRNLMEGEQSGPVTLSRLMSQWPAWRYKVSLYGGRPHEILALIFLGDPRDVSVLGLGPRWIWIYRILAPALALRRVIANSLKSKRLVHGR